MQVSTEATLNFYQLRAKNPQSLKVYGKPLTHGRYLVGSSDSCDIVIDHASVSPIHAIMEIFPQQTAIYELSGKLTIQVQGKSAPVHSVKLKDEIQLCGLELIFDKFYHPPGSPTHVSRVKKNVETESAPELIYPFDQSYNFEQSEYIFEDTEQLYPIFKYNPDKHAVELIILHNDKIVSMDFLPEKSGMYYLAGISQNESMIEFPYLSRMEKIPFVEVQESRFFIQKLPNFQCQLFGHSTSKLSSTKFEIEKQDIVKFTKGNISLILRYVDSPPQVTPAPMIEKDKFLLWLISLTLLLMTIPAVLFTLIEIKKEDLVKDNSTERLAKVIYNTPKKKIVETVKSDEKLQLKDVKKSPETKSQAPDPKMAKTISLNDEKPRPEKDVQKGAPPKGSPGKTNAGSASSAKSDVKVAASSPVKSSQGGVDVYKSGNFASTVSTIVAKSGGQTGVRSEGFGKGAGTSTQGVGVSGGSGVTAATTSDRIGDLSGSAKGVEDFNSGTKGLTKGKQFYSSAIPQETIVVGLMDPDVILKILREHIPQFRYCYQKEIETSGENIQGQIKLSFTIGSSGNVTKAGILNNSSLPSEVKKCVVNVLQGIQFPKLRAEGVVEVVQPFNFYPK
jgi:outer membrane biosynthesis protein TonB